MSRIKKILESVTDPRGYHHKGSGESIWQSGYPLTKEEEEQDKKMSDTYDGPKLVSKAQWAETTGKKPYDNKGDHYVQIYDTSTLRDTEYKNIPSDDFSVFSNYVKKYCRSKKYKYLGAIDPDVPEYLFAIDNRNISRSEEILHTLKIQISKKQALYADGLIQFSLTNDAARGEEEADNDEDEY